MFKNIIFDWSGVIKDSVEDHLWVVNKMFEKLGVGALSLKELKNNWKQPYMVFYNKYAPGLTLEDEKKIYYEVIGRKDCPEPCPYPGITELIKKLKENGISMAVLSSDTPVTILPEMKSFGLENMFDDVNLGSHDKAEEIHDVMEKNNFKKDETVFIGDSNHEVEVGKQAGIKTIAVTWGFCAEENLKATNPDYLVHNIKELEDILL